MEDLIPPDNLVESYPFLLVVTRCYWLFQNFMSFGSSLTQFTY